MTNPILGIDISKKTFDVALLRGEKFKHKKFGNGEAGFKDLSAWLARFEVDQLHVCMEATSSYGDANEPKIFSTWWPKVIAGIGSQRDTLEDCGIGFH